MQEKGVESVNEPMDISVEVQNAGFLFTFAAFHINFLRKPYDDERLAWISNILQR